MRCGTCGKATVRPRSSVTRTPVAMGDAFAAAPCARASDTMSTSNNSTMANTIRMRRTGVGFIARVLSRSAASQPPST